MIKLIKDNAGWVALVILAIVLGYGALKSHTISLGSATACTDNYTCLTNLEVQGNLITDGTMTGAAATLSGLLKTDGGILQSYALSTTTGTAVTLKQSDILSYNTILMTPIVGATTVTFPASSTLSSFVPTAGDVQDQCWVNASSTSAITITFAAGTGINLQVASSTTNIGLPTLAPLGTACFHFIRIPNTDINAVYTRYVDGD